MKKIWITGFVLSALAQTWTVAEAAAPCDVRWHDENNDTCEVARIITVAQESGRVGAQERVGLIAREFLGRPYVAGTLEGVPEKLTVDMAEVDCTTLVEEVLALARASMTDGAGWQNFLNALEEMRYRNGKVDGYASRLHYISDWAMENIQAGRIKDVTLEFPGADYQVKTLDFMTTNRDKYPRLADDGEFKKMKNVEMGYRSHRFPMIKSTRLGGQALRMFKDGDMVALTTKINGLDVQHLGFIALVEGTPHLLHASSKAGKVVIDSLPLTEYLRRNRTATGLRVFRLAE